MFFDGFKKAIDKIEPKTILVYDFVTESNFDEIFGYAESKVSRLLFLILKLTCIRRRMRYMGQGSKYSNGSKVNGLGTKGGQINLQNEKSDIINKNQLLDELIKSGVKINPKDIVFTAKDKSGQVVWLENGNTIKGLEHIKKHANDFVTKHNIQKKNT